MSDGFGGWDLPFEPEPAGASLSLDDAAMAGEITAMAGVLPTPPHLLGVLGIGAQIPVLILRFGIDPFTRQQIPPVALILTPDYLAKVPELVAAAVRGAIEAAKR